MLFASANSVDSSFVECGLLVMMAICAMSFLAFLSLLAFLSYSALFPRHVEGNALSHLEAVRTSKKNAVGRRPCNLRREDRRALAKIQSEVEGLIKDFSLQLQNLRCLSKSPSRSKGINKSSWMLPDAERVLEERERLAMQLEEAAQGTKLAEDEVARVLAKLSQSAEEVQQLYDQLYASQGVETDIRRENAALKEELKTMKEALPDVEQMQGELKRLRGIVDELKHDCLCPIRQSPMICPVVAADGHSYDRKAIERWVVAHGTSPMTNMALPNGVFVPNILASKFVSSLTRYDATWGTSTSEESSDDDSSEHTPHAWSSDHSSERDGPPESREAPNRPDVFSHGQAAEVLRALLSHDMDDIYSPVEAIWNIRNANDRTRSSDLDMVNETHPNPSHGGDGSRRPPGHAIAFDDTW